MVEPLSHYKIVSDFKVNQDRSRLGPDSSLQNKTSHNSDFSKCIFYIIETVDVDTENKKRILQKYTYQRGTAD